MTYWSISYTSMLVILAPWKAYTNASRDHTKVRRPNFVRILSLVVKLGIGFTSSRFKIVYLCSDCRDFSGFHVSCKTHKIDLHSWKSYSSWNDFPGELNNRPWAVLNASDQLDINHISTQKFKNKKQNCFNYK